MKNTYNNLKNVVSESGQSRTVRVNGEWILVFRSPSADPDAITDLKRVLIGLDIEDIRYIRSVLLVGSRKSVRVDSNLVDDLVGNRSRSPVIINQMKDELDRDFGYKIHDRGPHLRLAIRLPITEIKDFMDEFTPRIKDIIVQDGTITPDTVGDILSVYLIADETYVRLEPGEFFLEIFDLEGEAVIEEPQRPTPSDQIIVGESPQELIELALKKLKGHQIYRDIRFVEAAGVSYSFDALAVQDDERILVLYRETVTEEDLMAMELYLELMGAHKGWLLTRDGQREDVNQTDTITILTVKDL